MATSVTLTAADRFPAGSLVSAFPASNWLAGQLPPAGTPAGSSVASATVTAAGAAVLGGLEYETRYFAHALVGSEDRYVRFSTAAAPEVIEAVDVVFEPEGGLVSTDVQAAIVEAAGMGGGGGADASTSVKGIAKLSAAPVSATDPIAVGTNDVRVTADQVVAQASVRTIGSGAQQAAGGTHTHSVPDAAAASKGVVLLSVAPASPTAPIAVGANDPLMSFATLVTLSPATSARNVIQPSSASAIPLVVKGAAAQTANLEEWQDSSGTALAYVRSDGGVVGRLASMSGGNSYFLGGELAISNSASNIRFAAGNWVTTELWVGGAAKVSLSASGVTVDRLIWKSANEQTTIGAAGAASALPATPTKYLKFTDSTGATLVVPAYAP